MNVSGLNIDVGIAMAQTSSTCSIPNISVTQIPPNSTNAQMNVSEVPGSTTQISSEANPQSKFPFDFLLNPGQNPVACQEPFGQSKQPNLNISSGSQVYVGHEKRVEGAQQKRPLENVTCSGLLEGSPGFTLHQSDEIYAFSPLVLKEKVTGCHQPYASKPRTAQASSLREKIVVDEDEKMSPNHSETNDEPRRDNFMTHEEGTPSNSDFTHPQMPIAQSILEQSETRLSKLTMWKMYKPEGATKMAESRIPKNVHGMRSAVHAHCLFLLEVRDKDFSSPPAPPSAEEGEIAIQVAGHLGYVPKDVFNEPSTQVQSQVFQSYCKNELHKLGLGELMAASVQQVDVYGVLPYLLLCTCKHQVSSLLLEQGS
ncbi:hypothetical protein O181_000001 [Austropuccinia psidii MF-1]|uniref:Uncharacterized protein n=1 Tax=Austropuccinia psidii MF-1 TaxID=1389203 RepID=A0A9Q3GB68_9BASI|nr:hypothetical protein [Austropuccinia psidii MF-1]